MTGKTYTIREMKTIVDYLVETKAYGEIKGRKMWMDFASSQLTNRTWQSLKETFLKRVLPDIHNPYYKLTMEQINSFRAGYDIKDKNKLQIQEVQSISDDSNSNEISQPNNKSNGSNSNKNEAENAAGENTNSTNNPSRSRSADSVDTVIVDNCYETAEEIQRDLESPRVNPSKEKTSTAKSFRDCITYSEPLTPMLQEVLHDFNSDAESDLEGQMQIDEGALEIDNTDNIKPEVNPEETNETNKSDGVSKNDKDNNLTNENTHEVKVKETAVNSVDPLSESFILNNSEPVSQKVTDNNDPPDSPTTTKNLNNVNQTNNSDNSVVLLGSQDGTTTQFKDLINSTGNTDASLPNNPEALNNHTPNTVEDSVETSNTKPAKKITRKRSSSKDSKTESKKKKIDKPKNSKKTKSIPENVSEKLEPPKDSAKPDESIADDTNKDSDITNIPDVSNDNKHIEDASNIITIDTEDNVSQATPAPNNPCLKNVSLFDEQFSQDKYISSESEVEETTHEVKQQKITEVNQTNNDPQPQTSSNVKKQTHNQNKNEVASNDIVVLRSHSNSDTEEIPPLPQKRDRVAGSAKSERHRKEALANMFGFSSGTVGTSYRKKLSLNKRKISHNNTQREDSNSSQWTSESDSEEYVSPPRGRKNKRSRKYLKPNSARVLSLEEEGGLFVMYGKKIYPIVKDGNIVKNYLNYLPNSASENDDDYWKQKYVEEKKRAAELKKLLDKMGESRSARSSSPSLQSNSKRTSTSHRHGRESVNRNGAEICIPGHKDKKEETKVIPPPPTEKITIKFTKNNEELQLEGHWAQIHPMLEQVVQIFHKEPEPVSDNKAKAIVEAPIIHETSSGISTPINIIAIDPDVHEKVDQIEEEIFKEIEERDKEVTPTPEINEKVSNVTKRKIGRPKSNTSSAAPSPAKRLRVSSSEVKEDPNNSHNSSTAEPVNNVTRRIMPRRTRSPAKTSIEPVNHNETRVIQTRKSKGIVEASNAALSDEDVRYMLPSQTNKSPKTSTSYKNSKKQKSKKSSTETAQAVSPPDYSCMNSVDSTQGYQDSDISPVKMETRRKKRMSLSTVLSRGRRSSKSRAHPYLNSDASNESSNSSFGPPVKIAAPENSSLNTEAYRSESYQLLMPLMKHSFVQLQRIDEINPNINGLNFNNKLGTTFDQNQNLTIDTDNYDNLNSGPLTSDMGSSSMSLPLSPELSVVENLSISRDAIQASEDFPTINETQTNEKHNSISCSKYMISDIDVSMPLMEQDCEFESCNAMTTDSTAPDQKMVTESLLSKIGTINIDDKPNLTDTLDLKLRDLLLESAKKIASTYGDKENVMEVDEIGVEPQNKPKSKKRCSTPRKRKTSKAKAQAPTVEPVVEEEHVEFLSRGGRKSCPPTIGTIFFKDNVVTNGINIANLTIDKNDKPNARKKKDIIKVKILRPKNNKAAQQKIGSTFTQNSSKVSICTDSGINDTVSGLFPAIDESVDLIHNHSDTCLHANECVGDSVELVETSMQSAITLGDSMNDDNMWSSMAQYDNAKDIPPEVYCNNAQDVQSFYTASNPDKIGSTPDTVYHSPISVENCSMITEDLSDDPPSQPAHPMLSKSSKWYLLSEEDTTNPNMANVASSKAPSFGANLNQIFPITCAIPDLSTITEMSRENDDNSRKPTILEIDDLCGEDFDSQSMF